MSTKKKGGALSLLAIVLATPLVLRYEGASLVTYDDPVGIPTVCMGETDRALTMRGRFSREECLIVLGASLREHADGVSKCIGPALKDHEAAAVLSWTYNVGVGAACDSTLVRRINRGEPASAWCHELSKWIYAKGKVLAGLVKRREAELRMCLGEA